MTFIKLIIVIVILVLSIVYYSLYKNGANLFQDPGPGERLQVFLTSNKAITSDDHKFIELRTPTFNINAEQLFKRVLGAATELGWEVLSHDSDNQNANFIVYSPVFLFEDDVFVQVQFISTERSSIYIDSKSRKGRADFAANSGHIQALLNKLQ